MEEGDLLKRAGGHELAQVAALEVGHGRGEGAEGGAHVNAMFAPHV